MKKQQKLNDWVPPFTTIIDKNCDVSLVSQKTLASFPNNSFPNNQINV